MAKNSFRSAFLDPSEIEGYLAQLDEYGNGGSGATPSTLFSSTSVVDAHSLRLGVMKITAPSNVNYQRVSVSVVAPPRFEPINRTALCSGLVDRRSHLGAEARSGGEISRLDRARALSES